MKVVPEVKRRTSLAGGKAIVGIAPACVPAALIFARKQAENRRSRLGWLAASFTSHDRRATLMIFNGEVS